MQNFIARYVLDEFRIIVQRGEEDPHAVRVITSGIDNQSGAVLVVYRHPSWSHSKLGLRRVYSAQLHPDDYGATGAYLWAEIAEPLGVTATHLRYDTDVIGWWGDLNT